MPRVSKINVWFKHFTNQACKETFLNKTASAKAAGYQCSSDDSFRSVGHQNFTKLSVKINQWLETEGLSEESLKIKMLALLHANETRLVTIKGVVDPSELPENCELVTTSVSKKAAKGGSIYEEVSSVVTIHMEARETQRRTLDMVMKAKGMYEKDNTQKQTSIEIYNQARADIEREMVQEAFDKIEQQNQERDPDLPDLT